MMMMFDLSMLLVLYATLFGGLLSGVAVAGVAAMVMLLERSRRR